MARSLRNENSIVDRKVFIRNVAAAIGTNV